MDIANQAFAATRADINAALQALVSQNSGATAPATTFAHQPWADTATGLLKQRNAANSTWLPVLFLATGLPYGAGTPSAATVLKGDGSWGTVSASGLFTKADTTTVAFTKTGSGTISIKAGTVVDVLGTSVSFASATALTMPALSAGTDYAIYACQDGTCRADSSFVAPSGYTTANSRQIGGFHYGLVASGTTVAGRPFNPAGSVPTGGMVWAQTAVDNIAGINLFSLWDLKWRPYCDPRGMTLVNNTTWVDIYFCSTDPGSNGTSKYNTNIASGTVLPKIPTIFGGNGTTTYTAGDWWSFNEIARAYGKRFMYASEFYAAAFGVTENQSIDATASTYPTTPRNAGYTSKFGLEEASGHHWTWGMDASGTTPTAYVANGGRGQSYENSTTKVILGGTRTNGADSGSRCSKWNNVPSSSL